MAVTKEIAEEMDRVFGGRHDYDPTTDIGHRNMAPDPVYHKGPPLGPDMVVLPQHYARYAIEPINFIAANGLDFLAGNIVKYTARAEHKHQDKGREDSLKVVRYAIMRGKKLLGDPDWWKPYRNPVLAEAIEQELTYAPKD